MSLLSKVIPKIPAKILFTVLPVFVYPLGDFIIQLILNNINHVRIIMVFLAGLLLYRWEIPQWFTWLAKFRFDHTNGWRKLMSTEDAHLNWLGRTIGALLYFNPLWIARHMLIIDLGVHHFVMTSLSLEIKHCLILGVKSFFINLPLSFIGNYIVQTKVQLNYRFLGSVVVSTVMAMMYAIGYKYFG